MKSDILALIVFFMMGFNLCIPVMQKQFEIDAIPVKADPLGDPPSGSPYDYWYAPPNSFGIEEMKTVNWSYFKDLFLAHTDWMLEYKRYSYNDWTDGLDYLTIERTWNDTGFWKFNLILDVPVDIYSARFTFGIDLPCLQYVEHEGYEVWVNYTANATETYSVMFNWSDIASIPGLIITKGRIDDMFWFRFRRDDIPAGHYEFDPTFGHNVEGGDWVGFNDRQLATWGTATGGNGTADNISAYLKFTGACTGHLTGALFTYVGDADAGTVIAEISEIDISGTDESKWYTLSFGESGPSIVNNTKYFVAILGEETSGTINCYATGSSSGYSIYTTRAYSSGFLTPWTGEGASSFKRSIYCSYTVDEANATPTQSGESPVNASTGIAVTPSLYVICTDADADTMTATWRSNSSGPWVDFDTNSSIATGTNITQTNSNFSAYSTTYWWSVNLTDGIGLWDNETYHFTTEADLNTTVDSISPYNHTTTPLQINATSSGATPDNVTLWYRYSTDNTTWDTNHINWYSFGKNQTHMGYTTTNFAPIDNTVLWTVSTSGAAMDQFQGACIVDGIVYTQGKTDDPGDKLTALYLNNGTEIWNFSTGPSDSVPTYDETYDTIYVQVIGKPEYAGEHKLWCVYSSNGTMKWNISTEGSANGYQSNPILDDINNLVITQSNGNIWGVYRNNGTVKWNITAYQTMHGMTYYNHSTLGDIFVSHTAGNGTKCYYSNNGTIIWANTSDVWDGWDSHPICTEIDGEEVFLHVRYTGGANHILLCGNLTTGEEIWRWTKVTGAIDGGLFSISYHDEKAYVTGKNDTVYCINCTIDTPPPDRMIWYTALPSVVYSQPIIANGFIYVGVVAYSPNLYCLWENNGTERWNYTMGSSDACYSQPAIADGVLVVLCDDGNTYAFGDLSEYNASISGQGWMEWNDNSNPDSASPWSWDFNFPNSTGYYEFYSISNKSGLSNETAPSVADAICHYKAKEWATLDTWNLTLSNQTISPYILDTWNLTLSNTPESFILDTWNLTLSNETISQFTIDTWNITLSNISISAYTLDIWNVTLSNTTESYVLDTWNITLSNTTAGVILDTWNITLSNTSSHAILEPSFETVTNWIYYENKSHCYGEQSSSGVTDGSKSYELAVETRVETGYCRVYQTHINLTNINNIYADLYLNSDAAVDVQAYVSLRVNDDILYERKIGQSETILIRNVSIDVSGYGDYCTLEYRLNQTETEFYDDGIFAYIDNLRTSIWHTLDTWNITLSNLTISPYTLDTWNLTLSNTPQPYTLDTWNLTLSNLTISPYTLDTWNITLSNLTISPYILDTWNITLSNTPEANILDTWNLTLSNETISPYVLDTWNLTLGNLSISPFTIDTWNITIGNLTISPYILDTWNITLSNTTVGEILDTWNLTLSNLTIAPFTIDTWNITLSNTPQPYTLDQWNITLSNTPIPYILDRWNLTLSNTSFFFITDVKATPSEGNIDETINITCNVTSPYAIVNVTVNMTSGVYDMISGIGDLYYYNMINSSIGTHYYHIYANDTSGDQLESATYSFRIIGLSCSFTYTVRGGLMTLTPTITGATHYQWTFINETGVTGQTSWIPIGDIGSYIQGYVYPTTIIAYLSAKNINFNQYANFSDVIKIYKSSFDKTKPAEEEPEPEPSNVFKDIADTVGKWMSERNSGELLFMAVMSVIAALFVIRKKYPSKKFIYPILKKKKKKEKEMTPHERLIERIDRLEENVFSKK